LSQAGIIGYSGSKGSGPSLLGTQVADISGGTQNAIISILAAVISRASSGVGQFLDVSMTDGAIALNAIWGPGTLLTGEGPGVEETMLNGGMLYDFYETKDCRYISIGSIEPKFWENLCHALGKEEWVAFGVDAGPAVKTELRELFLSKTLAEWEPLFEADACVRPVLSLSEALNSDYAAERGMVVDVEDDSGDPLQQIGSPFKFSGTPVVYGKAGKPPSLESTLAALRSLGFSEERIIALVDGEVLE
jgi:crotonobetainyl-CoA:carnitine CoA-transferase CaiB-like acyl-CoA transferase